MHKASFEGNPLKHRALPSSEAQGGICVGGLAINHPITRDEESREGTRGRGLPGLNSRPALQAGPGDSLLCVKKHFQRTRFVW